MSEFLLKYVTGGRLAIAIISLLFMQVLFLLIMVFLVPSPTFEDNVLATRCLDGSNSSSEWLYPRGNGSCEVTETNEVIYAFQLPLAEFSRWQQYLLGILQLDITCQTDTLLIIDARLAYRDNGDPDDAWKLYASSVEERVLVCDHQQVPLFNLGSLHHSYYLLNIRLPQYRARQVEQIRLRAIHQRSAFTQAWVSIKTALFSLVIKVVITFWQKKRLVPRPPTLLEYLILLLAAGVTLLNTPLEYFTLELNMPFMLLLNDIRQNIFCGALLSFWLVFAGELLKVPDSTSSPGTLRCYWKHLTAVAIGCLSLFICDICQHSTQLHNSFSYSDTNLPLTINILAGICVSVYFIFLCYMMWKVFRTLSIKNTVLPNMSVAQLIIQKRYFNRLKFLVLLTLLCAALTITDFIVARGSQRYWQWNGDLILVHTSAFFHTVYIMWNMFTCAVLVFCIPICVPVSNSAGSV